MLSVIACAHVAHSSEDGSPNGPKQAVLYKGNQLAIEQAGLLDVRDDSGKILFSGLANGKTSINLGPFSGNLTVTLDGKPIAVSVINPKVRLRKLAGVGASQLLIHGTNWETDFNTEKSPLNSALITLMKSRGPLYLCEYTIGELIEEKARICLEEYRKVESQPVAFAVAISQGAEVLNSMLQQGLNAKTAVVIVPPNNGILPTFDWPAVKVSQLAAPEISQMVRGSTYYAKLAPFMSGITPTNYYSVALNTAGSSTDLLIGNDSEHHYTASERRITVASATMSHYNMDDQGPALFAKIIADIMTGNQMPNYAHVAGAVAAPATIISGMPYVQGSDGNYAARVTLAGISVELVLDEKNHQVRLDGVIIGSFDSISNGQVVGYRANVLTLLPASLQSSIRIGGIEMGKVALALGVDGQLTGLATLRYMNGSMSGVLLTEVRWSRSEFTLKVNGKASALVSAFDGKMLVWTLNEAALSSVNGRLSGHILVSGGTRFELSHTENVFKSSINSVIVDFESDLLKSQLPRWQLAGFTLTGTDFSPAGFVIGQIVKNNLTVKLEANVSFGVSLRFGFEDRRVYLDAQSGVNADGKAALQLFGIDLLSLKGEASASINLKSDDLSKYIEFGGRANGSGSFNLLIIPILGANANANIAVRVSFDETFTNTMGHVDGRIEGKLTLFTLISEDVDFTVDIFPKKNYRLNAKRSYWDVFRDITLSGVVEFKEDLETGFVTVTRNTLRATGRASTVFGAEAQSVGLTPGVRSLQINEVKLTAYSEGSMDIGCGKWTFWRTPVGDTWLPAMALAW